MVEVWSGCNTMRCLTINPDVRDWEASGQGLFRPPHNLATGVVLLLDVLCCLGTTSFWRCLLEIFCTHGKEKRSLNCMLWAATSIHESLLKVWDNTMNETWMQGQQYGVRFGKRAKIRGMCAQLQEPNCKSMASRCKNQKDGRVQNRSA